MTALRHLVRLTISLSFFGNAVVALAEPLFHRGNVNSDATADISDAIFIFNYLFLGGTAPACLDAADVNDDGHSDISDGVYLLSHLFQGGPAPPSPFPSPGLPCLGPDPTPDGLDCVGGAAIPGDSPSLAVYPTIANALGVRERNRVRLTQRAVDGVFLVPQGVSFTILLEATSNRVSRAGFALEDPRDPGHGNAETLWLTCDRALGDPEHDGAAAGENLAAHFFADLDGWKDTIFLVEHVGWRLAHDGPLAPAPGVYRFTASVTDVACARSNAATFALEVVPSQAPEVFAWIETAASPLGTPLPHHPGSGNSRVDDAAFTLVIDVLPRGGENPPAPDPSTLRVVAEPALAGTSDLTPLLAPDPSQPGRFHATFDPQTAFPELGNTSLTIEVGTSPDANLRRLVWTLERSVSYGPHVQPIWDSQCTGCHERPMLEKGLELVAPGVDPARLWRNIVYVYASEPVITSAAPLHIWPYFPEQSYLLHKLIGTHQDAAVGGSGVRMPKDAEALGAGTMHVIRSWIAQGAER